MKEKNKKMYTYRRLTCKINIIKYNKYVIYEQYFIYTDDGKKEKKKTKSGEKNSGTACALKCEGAGFGRRENDSRLLTF